MTCLLERLGLGKRLNKYELLKVGAGMHQPGSLPIPIVWFVKRVCTAAEGAEVSTLSIGPTTMNVCICWISLRTVLVAVVLLPVRCTHATPSTVSTASLFSYNSGCSSRAGVISHPQVL